MGIIEAVDGRAGTLVWVQKKNGSWWPGRVVGPSEASELAPAHDLFSLSKTKTPIKLLGMDHATLDWYNLEKSRRIKSFRCGEFDDFIEKAASSQFYPTKKPANYVHREDAILHALKLEKHKLQKKPKEPGEDRMGTVFRAKRSRFVYFPTKSNNCLERTVSHSQPLQVSPFTFGMDDCSLRTCSARQNSSHASIESESSHSDSQYPEINGGVTQHSGNYNGQTGNTNCKEHDELTYVADFPLDKPTAANIGVQNGNVKGKRPRIVLKEKKYVRSPNGTLDKQDPLVLNSVSKDHIRTGYDTKSREDDVWEANTTSQTVFGSGYFEELDSQCFGLFCIDDQSRMESMLIDVHLTIQASNREEHAPLVCLISRLNGQPIMGHPIEIEAFSAGGSEIPPSEDDINKKKFDIDRSAIVQQVWKQKTCKRTPVCYVACSRPSVVQDYKTAQACKNHGHQSVKGRGKKFLQTQEFIGKSLKKPRLSQPETRTPSFVNEWKHTRNVATLQDASQSCLVDCPCKPKGTVLTGVTCVPLEIIFSKLLVAIGSHGVKKTIF